jgi:hypothetical protein
MGHPYPFALEKLLLSSHEPGLLLVHRRLHLLQLGSLQTGIALAGLKIKKEKEKGKKRKEKKRKGKERTDYKN